MVAGSFLADRKAARARAGSSRWPWLVPLIPAVVALLVTGWRLSEPTFWRDETATISVARRSPSEILELLGNIDAVHGLYYLLMHPVVRLFGSDEIAMRAPSVLAAAVAAAVTAMIGARLADRRVGLVAGLLVAVAPAISRYAQEARQYTLATAVAVVATYLLVRAAERGDRRWFAAYAGSVALLGWLQIFYVLIIPAHAVLVATTHERTLRTFRRWLIAVVLAVLAIVPLLPKALSQRKLQVGWIAKPDGGTLRFTLEMMAGGGWLIVPVVALVVLALLRPVPRTGPVDPRWTAAAWVLLPPAILLASSLIVPNYVFRYVLFCVPAVALMAALALRRLPVWVAVLVVLGLTLGTVPEHLKIREPDSRADDIRALSAVLGEHRRPGDAIVFTDQRSRRLMTGYPDSFRGLNDIALAKTSAASASIDGTEVSPAELATRLSTVRRVWFVRRSFVSDIPVDKAKFTLISRDVRHWRNVARYRYKGGTVTLYERR
ncbi:glycosyltransferase family 39 protein [Spirillospora sp. NPDC047279]|uniref:glycosyltransferase family 39 protein n=1 Tax=Spirillospora sp. NPDC047279 TaxID=3155478 RepID=UPI00340E7237